MNDSVKFTLFYAARVLVYAGFLILLNAIYMYDAENPTVTGKFGEVSMTEITQEVFLILLVGMFIFVGRIDRQLKPIANLISVFFLMAFIRELDHWIDFWFYLVLPMIVLFTWLLFRDRKKFFQSFHRFLEIPYTAYFVIGFLVTFVFCRFFGRTVLWETILESDYNRWAKNAAEEGIELLGYSLFFIAGVEILLSVIRKRREAKQA